jgi:hypothetical protein
MARTSRKERIEGRTARRTKRYAWAWRHLDFSVRLALVFAHRLPKGHPDRTGLAQVIRKIVRKPVQEKS